jgi:mono/diheme cytochrome c family protein
MNAKLMGITSFCMAVGVSLFAVHAQDAPKPQSSVWDGVYTAEQANHGKSLYNDNCMSCHGSDLTGTEVSPALTGSEFLSKWNSRTLDTLFTTIHDTMPEGNAGTLSPEADRDTLAYILSVNGFPAGKTELPQESDKLSQIRIDASKPGAH